MLSDDSSSDSETGRFKESSGKKESERGQKSHHRDNKTSRQSDGRDLDRKDERHRSSRHSPNKHRSSRHSSRSRRQSYDRSTHRERKRSSDRHRSDNYASIERHSYDRRRSPDHGMHSREIHHHRHGARRSYSKEKARESQPKYKTPSSREVSKSRVERSVSYERRSPNEFKSNRSAIHRPSPAARKLDVPSPIDIIENEDEEFDLVQPASYYNSLPTVKEDIESSEIDSSDEESLRAKLLHLEKELVKNKKRKHRKKHKKSLKSKNRDKESAVEVTSTTDIDKILISDEVYIVESDTPEVSSTQTKPGKGEKNESSEEGEITSDIDHITSDDKRDEVRNIDLEDLRHKLNRDKVKEVCGPALPPHLNKRSNKSSSSEIEGPELPPHLRSKQRNIGPSISSDLREVLANNKASEYTESDEDDGIGPIPVGSVKWSDAHQRLEERALDIKINKLEGHNKDGREKYKREVWMTELPEAKAKYLGLEARQFRAKEGPDMSDRSSWTDLPADKARKAKGLPAREDKKAILLEEARSKYIADRDTEQEYAVKKHKKKHKREESLLDMHQKKLKKKKKKEDDEKKERRPFNRDTDLQVNRFDEAQKKSIIKKAQHLDTRFSSGEAKYL